MDGCMDGVREDRVGGDREDKEDDGVLVGQRETAGEGAGARQAQPLFDGVGVDEAKELEQDEGSEERVESKNFGGRGVKPLNRGKGKQQGNHCRPYMARVLWNKLPYAEV